MNSQQLRRNLGNEMPCLPSAALRCAAHTSQDRDIVRWSREIGKALRTVLSFTLLYFGGRRRRVQAPSVSFYRPIHRSRALALSSWGCRLTCKPCLLLLFVLYQDSRKIAITSRRRKSGSAGCQATPHPPLPPPP